VRTRRMNSVDRFVRPTNKKRPSRAPRPSGRTIKTPRKSLTATRFLLALGHAPDRRHHTLLDFAA
jgi:hypothetical protein